MTRLEKTLGISDSTNMTREHHSQQPIGEDIARKGRWCAKMLNRR